MSIEQVTARIGELQAQLARFVPARPVSSPGFSASLREAAPSGRAGQDAGVSGEMVVTEARKYLGVPYVWGSS